MKTVEYLCEVCRAKHYYPEDNIPPDKERPCLDPDCKKGITMLEKDLPEEEEESEFYHMGRHM